MGQGRQPFGGLETAKLEISLLLCSKKVVEKLKAAKTAKFFGVLQSTAFFMIATGHWNLLFLTEIYRKKRRGSKR